MPGFDRLCSGPAKTAPPAAGKPAALPKAKAVAAGGDDDWESV